MLFLGKQLSRQKLPVITIDILEFAEQALSKRIVKSGRDQRRIANGIE